MKTLQTILVSAIFAIATVNAFAQEETSTAATTTATAQEAPSAPVSTSFVDSAETRAAFVQILKRYPPQVGRVLKLDPSLLSNASYLATYPALAEFIARHPEIAHTPAFYLEQFWIERAPATASERMWEQTMEGIAIFSVMLLIVGTLVWLIRTLIEHRRWSRVSRTQVEVHNKLMDRLTSNEDLLAYMQTPAGKRFLESAPIPLDATPRAVSAPIGRILWSVQVGVILAMGGFGLQFVSRTVDKTASQPFMAMGTLGVAIGLGFLLSSFISFVMSKRLGLITQGEPAAPAE